MFFVHFSPGLVFSMMCSGYLKVRQLALCPTAFPLQLIPVWCPPVPLNWNRSSKSQWRPDGARSKWNSSVLISAWPSAAAFNTAAGRPASAGRPPHLAPLISSSPGFRTGHFSASSARFPPLLSSSSTQLLWGRFPRGQTVDTAYLVHTPKVNTSAGESIHICSIHAVAPATETKPGKNKKLSWLNEAISVAVKILL